jgi:site-specific DNA-methyltransferase (adenine-specific)
MASKEGDLVFDPFGGSGTTYIVAEVKKRRWIGVEIGPTEEIVERFKRIQEEKAIINTLRDNFNCLFTKETLKLRKKQGLWTVDSIRKRKARAQQLRLSVS